MYKLFLSLGCIAASAFAVDTRYWSQEAQSDFEKGTLKQMALRSDGRLSLSPQVKELADLSIPYLWSVAVGGNGVVYTAGGPASGRSAVFAVERSGQQKKLAELDGMNVFAMATDRNGMLYAATSPDGKVYRISAAGTVDLFYDPKAKYIWALAFLQGGDLLVATGDKGELHRVAANGVGKVFLKLDEDHVRSLAVDPKGTIYVGTEPSGLVVRVSASGEPFVVYQTAKREVTGLLTTPEGELYAAAIGLKAGGSMLMPTVPVAPPAAPTPQGAQPAAQGRPAAPPPAPVAPIVPTAVPGGSDVIRIDADGAPLKVWSHATELVYALALDANGKLLLGTGNKGALYRVESSAQYTLLRNVASTQITGFTRDGSRLLAVAGNIGKLYEIGGGLEREGSFESEVFDAGGFTRWGRMHVKEAAGGGLLRYETRSGNLDRPTQMWSAWQALQDGRVVSPAARFLQYRVVMSGGQQDGPTLSQVDVAYLPKNVAPRVEVVESTPGNYRFPAPSVVIVPAAATLTLPPIGKVQTTVAMAQNDGSSSPALTYAKGMIGARWLAVDDNGDTLEFTLEIQGEGEQTWRPLKDKIRDRYYSFDGTAFADGRYRVRVTATDAPGNAVGQALTGVAMSNLFLIDNTAPIVSNATAVAAGTGKLTVRFQAVDALSVITKAEVSLNGGAWSLVEPTVRLSDSKQLTFDATLDRPGAGEVVVGIRVTDEFDNQSVATAKLN
jgi:hypothetical protein